MWTFNDYEDTPWCEEWFDTKEEAINAGIARAEDEGWSSFFVGRATTVIVNSPFLAERVIYEIANNLGDKYGGDWEPEEAFLRGISAEDKKRLQELLDEALTKWVEERKIDSGVVEVDDVEEVIVEGVE